MAKLIPALIIFFLFNFSCNARSTLHPSGDDELTTVPVTNFSEEDVSDLKPLILLPTDDQLNSESVHLVNEEKTQPDLLGYTQVFQKIDASTIESSSELGRKRSIRCRNRQIRPREKRISEEEEEDEEIHHRHHHFHHGRKFHEGPGVEGVEGDERKIGEFKQPGFFFRRHHHHHHHHHHEEDEDEEEEMEHHHKHRRGFWRRIRKILGRF